MYFIVSYLKPLEKFRSKGQIISCVSNLHNCLNYPFCMWGHVTLGQPQSPASTSPSAGCEWCVMGQVQDCREAHSRGRSAQSHEQGLDQGEASEALRVQNLRRPDSQAPTLHRTNPESDISLNFKPESLVWSPESQPWLPAQALSPDCPASSLSAVCWLSDLGWD